MEEEAECAAIVAQAREAGLASRCAARATTAGGALPPGAAAQHHAQHRAHKKIFVAACQFDATCPRNTWRNMSAAEHLQLHDAGLQLHGVELHLLKAAHMCRLEPLAARAVRPCAGWLHCVL